MNDAPENTLFASDQVTVTTAQMTVPGHIYSIQDVAAVALRTRSPNQVTPLTLIVAGVCLALTLTLGGGTQLGVIFVSCLLILCGVIWLRTNKPSHVVALSTATGEVRALASPDKRLVEEVVQAVRDAIGHRGGQPSTPDPAALPRRSLAGQTLPPPQPGGEPGDVDVSAGELGRLDALYAEGRDAGQSTSWGALVEALRAIRRHVEAGSAVHVHEGPTLRTWDDFYSWAHARYPMLEDGINAWIGDDET